MKTPKSFLRTILALFSASQIGTTVVATSLETGPKVGDTPRALELGAIIQWPFWGSNDLAEAQGQSRCP